MSDDEPAGEPLLEAKVVREILRRSNNRRHAFALLEAALTTAPFAITTWIEDADVAELTAVAAAADWVHDELIGLMDSLDDSVSHEDIHHALRRLFRRLDDPHAPPEEN